MQRKKSAVKRKTTKVRAKASKRALSQKAPVVGIVYGSPSDESYVAECAKILTERFGIPCEQKLLSAHRMPDATHKYGKSAKKRGLKLIIGMAGMAAHLPGVLASLTTLPVLGVPLPGPHIDGTDALLSIVQMPAGVPVGSLAVGKAGAKNAALLAARILALEDGKIAAKVERLVEEMEGGARV
jgi:5-(carboxyamino)imidazole ribonucleotide mutase